MAYALHPIGAVSLDERQEVMTKSDRIIADLMNALNVITREAKREEANRHFIVGVATMASELCNAQRVHNNDGYLVVRQ